MLAALPGYVLRGWLEFASVRPFGVFADDARLAQIAYMQSNGKTRLERFMFCTPPELSQKELEQKIARAFAGF